MKGAGESHNANPQVIEALLDNIIYVSPRFSGVNPMSAPKYAVKPAFDALVSIGEPVIPYLLERIKRGDDEVPKGFVRSPQGPIEYVTGSSNGVTARIPLPRLKPGEWEILQKENRYSKLLRQIASERSVELLQMAIGEVEEQKHHLEKSLGTVRSLKGN